MCIEETCIPYCATHINDPICNDYGRSPKSNEPETTGEVCINVEYDGEHVPARPDTETCGKSSFDRGDCWTVKHPAYTKRGDTNLCVDVYKDDLTEATTRLDQLVEQKVKDNNWQNVKYYCMYGSTRLFMSIFQSDSLALSDKYCGKASEVAAAKPAVEEDPNRGYDNITF